MVFQQLPGHEGDVIGGSPVVHGVRPVVQTGAVDEGGVVHPQLLRPLVHHGDEGAFAARDMLRHGAGTVVGRGHRDGLEHVGNGHGLPCLQVDLAASLGGGSFGSRHHICQGDLPGIHRFHNQQHGHDLGHAGGGKALMGIGLIQNGSGGNIHQHRAFPRHIQLHRRRRQRNPAQRQHKRRDTYHPLHSHPSKRFVVQPMSAGDDYAGFLHRFVLFPGRYITLCCAAPYYILFCIYLISGEV